MTSLKCRLRCSGSGVGQEILAERPFHRPHSGWQDETGLAGSTRGLMAFGSRDCSRLSESLGPGACQLSALTAFLWRLSCLHSCLFPSPAGFLYEPW